MSLLRIHCSLSEPPRRCAWARLDPGREPVRGDGPLSELPHRGARVQLVIPAAQVVIKRAHLPKGAKRRPGSLLAFAVEEETLGEPDENHVIRLGSAGDADVLAVLNRQGLQRWLDALDGVGIGAREVHCETLLLPWAPGTWTLAWSGAEGYVRTGELEGAATDCGDWESPPLSLRLMLDEAQARNARPDAIAIHATAPYAMPDIERWQNELGVALHEAGPWNWATALPDAGVSLTRERRGPRFALQALTRLRPAAWIAGAALALHGVALVADWALLAAEHRTLRRQMESRFRATFPEAVAVTDPALQMRRKLAEARHAAGQPDGGDFLPMIGAAASGIRELPAGSLRVVSYENGRLTLELSSVDQSKLGGVAARFTQSGMNMDAAPTASRVPGKTIVTLRAP